MDHPRDRSGSFDVRPIGEEGWDDFVRCGELAFGERDEDDYLAWDRKHLPLERTAAAWDGDQLVGTSAALPLDLTVPGGGLVRVAGITWVSVLPTHRRRGALRAMMGVQHSAAAERGEPVAALWASESGIYRSVGYGMAGVSMRLRIPAGPGALRADLPRDPALRTRLVEPSDTLDAVEGLLDVERSRRGGVLGRWEAWSQRCVLDPEPRHGGGSPLRAVLVEDGSGVRAAARYSLVPRWESSLPQNVLSVRDAFAADAGAGVELWRYLLQLDLVRTAEVRLRPVDDPLLSWLVNPRAARPEWRDGVFVRLVDVAAALALRRYACDVDVVLEVHDPGVPANHGRFRLRGGLDGASCERTAASADLSIAVTELGAAYLGGTSLGSALVAGLLEEHTGGAAQVAGTAFGWPLAPWTPSVF